MELFSKRNKRGIKRLSYRYSLRREDNSEKKFLPDDFRGRIQSQIKYIINSNEFLEPFLVVKDENSNEYYLHEETLKNFGLRELGYDFSGVLDCKKITFDKNEYDDSKFFDFIETILIFTKKDKRDELEEKLKKTFNEEQDIFTIHGSIIIEKNSSGLDSVVSLIKEDNLRLRIEDYLNTRRALSKINWETLAQISADILQLLFSSPKSKKDTKKYAEDLCLKVSKQWTEKSKTNALANLISETVSNSKKLNNEISNIRHTDRSTIPVDMPNFYKLIASKNINIVELVILSLPEDYILRSDPEKQKDEYLTTYKIKRDNGWIVKKQEINIDDIPF